MRKSFLMRHFLMVTAAVVISAPILLAQQFSCARDATTRLSGSYQVVRKPVAGLQTHVQLHLRLSNPGPHDLHIQRLTLWDSPHPDRGGTQKVSLVLHAGTSIATNQEFTISHSDFELWSRGARPRLVLELLGPSGRTTTAVVRLDRASHGRGY